MLVINSCAHIIWPAHHERAEIFILSPHRGAPSLLLILTFVVYEAFRDVSVGTPRIQSLASFINRAVVIQLTLCKMVSNEGLEVLFAKFASNASDCTASHVCDYD